MRDCAWSVCTELGSVTFKKVGVARECAKNIFLQSGAQLEMA